MMRREPRQVPSGPAKPGFLRRALGAVSACLGILLALVLFLYAATCRFGLPRIFCARIEAIAREKGLDLRIHRIRPSWPGILLLERVRVSPGGPAFEARVEQIQIQFDLGDAFRGRATLTGATLRNGELLLTLGADADRAPAEPFRVTLLKGTVRLSGSRVELDLNGRALDGLVIRVVGALDLTDWEPSVPRRSLEETAARWVGQAVPALRKVRQLSGNVVWGKEAGAVLELSGGPGLPGGVGVAFRAEGRNGFLYGQHLEDWHARAEYRDGRIEPLDIRIACSGDELRLRGRVDAAGRRLDLTAEGTWNSASVLRRIRSWIPDEAARPPDSVLRGSARLEIRTGDAAWSNATAGLRARIRIEEPAEFYGVPFSRLDLEAWRDGTEIRWNLAELDLGWIAGAGRISGTGAFWMDTGEFTGKASGSGDPANLLALLTPSEAHHFGNLRFLGESPRLSAEFRGNLRDLSGLVLTGKVEGRDFVYQGTSVESAGFDLTVREETVLFDRLVVKRPEGELTGSVTLFLRDGRVAFDVVSRLAPGAIARVIGPTTHRFIQQFRFEGPVSVTGKGTLSYRRPVAGDLQLGIEARRAGMEWALADQIACTLVLSGRRLDLTGIQGNGYGGSFSGDARIDLSADGEEAPSYSLRGEIVNAEVVRILSDLRPAGVSNPELGRMTLRTDLKGRIGKGTGSAASGTGSIEVKGGRLFSLRLMGGLSQYLSRLAPGFGYLSQSELTSDFRIQDSRVSTDNVRLGGPWLSMRARGSLGFDLSLDFRVEAQLLRKGPIAGTVRVLTLPLAKLFEFELGGTVQDPRWQAKNFPASAEPAMEPGTAE